MKLSSLSAILICLAAGWTQAELVAAAGPVTSVVVYRGQALITRSLDLPQTGGEMELLVENLPEKILPESLYAQSDGSISVLSVRYREKTVTEDTREQVVALREQIEQSQRKLYLVRRDRELLAWRWGRYEEQWKLNLDATNRDLNTKGLDVEAFKNLIGHLDQQADAILKEQVRQETAYMDLEKQIAELEKQLVALAQGQQKVNRQALVYISRGERAKGQISLSYLVRDANWQPQYNLRAAADRSKATVEYNAVVQQSSGEDWLNAALALSTAEPTMVSAPPGLTPMKVTLGVGGPAAQQVQTAAQMPQMQGVFSDQDVMFDSLARSRRDNISKGVKAERELNTIAISNQMIELEADRRMLLAMKERAVAVRQTEGVSVMYALAGKLSLPSRTEQQILNIASFDCPAQFVFVASPLLTDYVYLQADIANTSETILLPGPASMFRNGEFVGRSEMKLVTSGQTFTASFGIDSQLQVVREFADTKTDVQLGSRTSEQHYRIALSNYKNVPVSVRVLDRIPWTDNASLAIELKETSHPLSRDAEYVRTERPKGILRWDMELAPNTSGPKAAVLTYVYAMKYDKSLSVVPGGQ
jgi:hypothetical protein